MIDDLKKDWGVVGQAEKQDGSIILTIGDFFCALALMPAPIPNDEAIYQAQKNYYCSDAVEIAKAHKTHLMVTVMGQTPDSHIEGMRLYSKLICSCLNQTNAIGVYTTGTVYSAEFYRQVAKQYLPSNQIPIMIWVFIGLGQTQDGNQLYTHGMSKFDKEEMEILNSQLPMNTLHSSLSAVCSYIISSNLTLKDGETIGFSAEQKWTITRSKSVYAPSEMSLRLGLFERDVS